MIENRPSIYRWYLLALITLIYSVITGLNRMCMPVLFKEISEDLNLSLVAVGGVWGADPLAGVIIGLPGGLLADRFGVKRTLTVICILAAVFGAMRGFSVNFLTMAFTMFLFGLMAAATPSVVPKMTAEWFSSKQLGMVNALINVGWSVGSMTATTLSATVISPAIGGWRNVMFLFAVPTMILGLLWLVTGRSPRKHELQDVSVMSPPPFRQSLAHVLRMKEVWIIGLINLTNWGANMGVVGYLPLYLRDLGWTPASADNTITVIGGVAMIGAIPMVMIAERTSRRAVLALSLVSLAVTIGLVPFASGSAIYVLITFGALMRSGTTALFTVMIFETKGVGSTYGGTAIGLANSMGMLGAFISPPLGNSLTSAGASTPFYFWGALAAAGLPLLYMMKDVRARTS
jgi:NNP family nitrate/nitrite transporter-like MFS transporter